MSSVLIELAELVKDPSRVADVDADRIPGLLAQLTAVQATIASRLVMNSHQSEAKNNDKLLNIDEAAARLGVSCDWLYRRTSKLAFVVRVGRHVRFSSGGIDRFIRNRMGSR